MSNATKPAVFYFSFNLDPDFHEEDEAKHNHQVDEEFNVTYAFAGEVRGDHLGTIQEDIDSHAEWIESIFVDCEGEFGVHDWISGPDDRVICFGGFDSYEVEPSRVMELMNAWKTALLSTNQIEASFGPIVQIPNGLESDWEAYEAAVSDGSKPG